MSFHSEGTFQVAIMAAEISESKFNKNDPQAFDVCLLVRTQDGQEDWWRGECSGAYGVGNASDRTQLQLTTETLIKVGLPDGNLGRYKELVGKQTVATTKQSSCGKYYNVRYLGGATANVEALDPQAAQNKIAALLGAQQQGAPMQQPGGFAPQPQQPQQFAQPPAGHPQQGAFTPPPAAQPGAAPPAQQQQPQQGAFNAPGFGQPTPFGGGHSQ